MNNNIFGFKSLVKTWKDNVNILGCILVGSRGKGFGFNNSDYDVVLITSKSVVAIIQKNVKKIADCDISVYNLEQFRKYAQWGSGEQWDRYDFTHVKIIFDKTHQLNKIIAAKGCLPTKIKKQFVSGALDGYINGVFRSVKCWQKENESGARLEAAFSIGYLLDAVFGINNRIKPFWGYLERELIKFPLKKIPLKSDEFLRVILNIVATADFKAQQKLLRAVKIFAINNGFGRVFRDWDGKDERTIKVETGVK